MPDRGTIRGDTLFAHQTYSVTSGVVNLSCVQLAALTIAYFRVRCVEILWMPSVNFMELEYVLQINYPKSVSSVSSNVVSVAVAIIGVFW